MFEYEWKLDWYGDEGDRIVSGMGMEKLIIYSELIRIGI